MRDPRVRRSRSSTAGSRRSMPCWCREWVGRNTRRRRSHRVDPSDAVARPRQPATRYWLDRAARYNGEAASAPAGRGGFQVARACARLRGRSRRRRHDLEEAQARGSAMTPGTRLALSLTEARAISSVACTATYASRSRSIGIRQCGRHPCLRSVASPRRYRRPDVRRRSGARSDRTTGSRIGRRAPAPCPSRVYALPSRLAQDPAA